MSQRTEYRIRWQREGRREKFVIRQSWSAAYSKARAVLAADEIAKNESGTVRYEVDPERPLPRLVAPPVIEERSVGAWEALAIEFAPPHEGFVQEVAWRMGVALEAVDHDSPF